MRVLSYVLSQTELEKNSENMKQIVLTAGNKKD
jgi:hypothetical protein